MSQRIDAPESGRATVKVAAGQPVRFSVDMATTTLLRPEADGDGHKSPDLVVRFENGAEVLLEGFFTATDDNGTLPQLELSDGSVVSGEEYLAALSPDLDLETAAGPSVSPNSSGAGDYTDGSGDLIDGVSRLGSLGTSQFSVEREPAENQEVLLGMNRPEETGFGAGPGTGPGGTPGTGGGEEPGPGPGPDPEGPLSGAVIRGALLGVGEDHDPTVVLPHPSGASNGSDLSFHALQEDGTTTPFTKTDNSDGTFTFTSPDSPYVVTVNADGTYTVSLSPDWDRSETPPSENLVIKTGDGEDDPSYILSLGGSDTNQLGDVDWADLPDDFVNEGLQGTWGGASSNHLTGGQHLVVDTGHNIATPDYDAEGEQLHLQYTDTSLTARDDAGDVEKNTSVTVDFTQNNAGQSSITISNENHVSDITVQHDKPNLEGSGWGGDYYLEHNRMDYEADLTGTVIAKGAGSESSVNVTGGEAIIKAGGGEPAQGSHAESRVSALYAMEGGTVDVNADKATIIGDSAGYSQNASKPTVVTGVRADGAVTSFDEESWTTTTEQASTVNVTGKEVDVKAVASGDANADYSDITYAAVAATEQGKVNITATEGEVNISVVNETSGDNLKTDGMHGIYAGYGLGRNDLPADGDFIDDGGDYNYGRTSYYKSMNSIYQQQKYKGADYETGEGGRNEQSEVVVKAAGDVNVNVDLGDADYYGAASGITASFGDVKVTSDQNINVTTRLEGEHRGEGNLSALRVDGGGTIDLKAEGDVTLRVDANGGNLAVVDVPANYYKGSYSGYKNVDPNFRLSGENVRIEGVAGRDGTANDNHITGINLGGSGYKTKGVTFEVDADKEFSIDVTAVNNGGATSATAIRGGSEANNPYNHMDGGFLNVDAPKVTINAQVDANGKPLSLDSHAKGISMENMSFALNAGQDYEYYEPSMFEALDDVTITVGGARYNTGIEAISENDPYHGGGYSRVGIAAKDLDIIVKGGATGGDSYSYGVNAVSNIGDNPGESRVNLMASDLNIEVQDANRAVALRADGAGSRIEITNVNADINEETGEPIDASPLNVYIKASHGIDGDMLKGIAVEAVNGGYVSIDSTHPNTGDLGLNDKIVLDGHVVIGGHESFVSESGNYYNEARSGLSIKTGEGDDSVSINGDVTVGSGGELVIEATGGNNVITIDGDVNVDNGLDLSLPYNQYYGGSVTGAQAFITTGDGHDNVTITGALSVGNSGNVQGAYYSDRYGTYQREAQGASAEINTGYGNDIISVGGINLTETGTVGQYGTPSTINIDAGEGNDVIVINGQVSASSYDNLTVSGGGGHDILVLGAPDSATFKAWYQDWLDAKGGLDGLDCESLVLQGVTDPRDVQWLLDYAEAAGINVQMYGPDVDITMVSDASQINDNYALNGDGDNDMLYVRYNSAQGEDGSAMDGLDGLHAALDSGRVNGLENLLIDMADDLFEQDGNRDVGFIEALYDKLTGTNSGAKLLIRADAENLDDPDNAEYELDFSTWAKADDLADVNGILYTVYTKDGRTVYVEWVSDGYSFNGAGGAAQDAVGPVTPDPGTPDPSTGTRTVSDTATEYVASNTGEITGTIEHSDPLNDEWYSSRHTANLDYTASVVAGVDSGDGLNAPAKDVTITAGGDSAPVTGRGADQNITSGVMAHDNEAIAGTAKSFTVEGAAAGYDSDAIAHATVTGVRAHGATYEDNGYEQTGHSRVDLTASGDVVVTAAVKGDTDSQNHDGIIYAGVAATEGGRVSLESTAGDVTVKAVNQATGEDGLNADGVYGVYAGYGLGDKDLPSRADFRNDDEYRDYMQVLAHERYQEHVEGGYDGAFNTRVDLKAAGDVGVSVELGSQDFYGDGTAVKTEFGDVNITSGKGVDVTTSLEGEYRGDGTLSALSLGSGSLSINAAEDVNIRLSANGSNLAAVNMEANNIPYYQDDVNANTVSGKNVTITAEAGATQGAAYENHVSGILQHSDGTGYKQGVFRVEAEDTFTLSATAVNNGGATSATGVEVKGNAGTNNPGEPGEHLFLDIKADKAVIEASVKNGDGVSVPGDNSATGLSVTNGYLSVSGGTAEGYDNYDRGYSVPGEESYQLEAVENLEIRAGGARHNTGIEVVASGWTAYDGYNDPSRHMAAALVKAENLSITVTGGEGIKGATSSYGARVESYHTDNYSSYYDGPLSVLRLESNNIDINVRDDDRAVGLSADGYKSLIEVTPGSSLDRQTYETTSGPLTMVINCSSLTNPGEQLQGIALEAVNGGHINIYTGDSEGNEQHDSTGQSFNDSIELNGDVVVGSFNGYDVDGNWDDNIRYNDSQVAIDTGRGNDTVTINGNVAVAKGGFFNIDTGEGSDQVRLSGDITLHKGGYFHVDTGEGRDLISIDGNISAQLGDYGSAHMSVHAGEGNDVIMLNGKIEGFKHEYEDDLRYDHFDVDGGDGHDLLVLSADSPEQFQEWYQGWLESRGFDSIGCEGIIIHGMKEGEAPDWLQSMMENSDVDFQFYGADVNLNMIADIANIDGYTFDGTDGANDMLYLRFDADNDDAAGLIDALGSGQIEGVEHFVLDMADGEGQSLDFGVLDDFLGSVKEHNAGANVILRMDENDIVDFTANGWTANDIVNINGVDYTQYTSADEQQLYVQLVTNS